MKIPTPASDRACQLGLASFRLRGLQEAEYAIRAMGADALPFLLAVMEEQRLVSRQQDRFRLLLFLPLFLGYLLYAFTLAPVLKVPDSYRVCFMACALAMSILFRADGLFRSTRIQRNSATLFADLADKSSIGVLIDLMGRLYGKRRAPIRNALTRLLPELRASDSEGITTGQRTVLKTELQFLPLSGDREQAEFMIALLQTLRQVGDGSFVAPVARLCQKEHYGLEARRVKQAAADCLFYLEDFAEQEMKSGTLVRAASAPEGDAQSTILVRPAASTNDAEPSLLLRPTGREGAE